MKYIVESYKLDKDHPNWPNETLYCFIEIATGKRSLGSYTTLEAATTAMRKASA